MKTQLKTLGQHQGHPVYEAWLESENQVKIAIISYGAIVREWLVPTPNSTRSVVLGFQNFEPYLKDTEHIGAIVGRVANRISNAEFLIGDKKFKLPANVGNDQLHGGPLGLGRKNWQMHLEEDSVILKYHSPDGDMGYPGSADFKVKYTLRGSRLRIEMTAQVSEITPINMVQHFYFNLMGHGSILDHTVQIHGDRITPLNERLTPTGEIKSVLNTPFDFQKGRALRDSQNKPAPFDINFALNTSDRETYPVALVTAPDNSLQLKLWTNQPGLQFYTGEHLSSREPGHSNECYEKFSGLCLEDQMFPDALNHPHFPSILISPSTPYFHWCEIEIN